MKKKCNICNKKFIDFLSLGKHPCADTFLKTKRQAKSLKKYPLVVGFCKCSHLTTIYPVPKYERYEKYDYSYTSDNSPVSRTHFKNIANISNINFSIINLKYKSLRICRLKTMFFVFVYDIN